MAACLSQAWIVSPEWIYCSFQQKKVLNPEPFEVRKVLVTTPTRSGRNNRQKLDCHRRKNRLVKLFSGVSIFLVAQEQREALSELIRMGGGKVLTQEPSRTDRSTYVVVTDEEEVKQLVTFEWLSCMESLTGLPPVNSSWLRDSICAGQLQDLCRHIAHSRA